MLECVVEGEKHRAKNSHNSNVQEIKHIKQARLNPAEPSIQLEEYNEPIVHKWGEPPVHVGNNADETDQE